MRVLNTFTFDACNAVMQGYVPREEVVQRVMAELKELKQLTCAVWDNKLTESSKFSDFRFDELDQEEMLDRIAKTFCIEIPESAASKIATPKDIIELVATHPRAK